MAKRKGKKKKARVIRIRRLNNQLIGVVLGSEHKSRGSDLAGYRVVRVTGAAYDRKLRQVVKIIARVYGGDAGRNGGWNGPKVVLINRRHFTGNHSLGVSVGKEMIPVDAFVRRPKELRGVPEMVKSNRPRPAGEPQASPRSVSGGSAPSKGPKIAPGASQGPPKGFQRGRKPRARPPKTVAPRFKDELVEEPDLPDADEFAESDAADVDLPPGPDYDGQGSEAGPAAASGAFEEDPVPARADALVPADDFKATSPLPPLLERAWNAGVDPALLKSLAALVRRKPSLVRAMLPNEPVWLIPCPDGDVLHFAGYGHRKGEGPVAAEVMALVTYQDPPAGPGVSGCQYVGSTMPAGKTNKAIKALLARETKNLAPDVEAEPRNPGKKKPTSKPPEDPNDYFK